MHLRLAHLLRLLGGAALLAHAWPSLAEAPADSAPAPVAAPESPVRITVGRAVNLDGKPAYASRAQFAGTASAVSFSYTRPRTGATAAGLVGSIPLGMPLIAVSLTSGFDMRVNPVTGVYSEHTGIDLAAPAGTPIAATADGVVGSAGWSGGYGLMVVLEHSGGLETRYAHMSRTAVTSGEQVHAGEVVGYVGSTGRSTGPHLHYETRLNGRPVDPLQR